MAPSSRPRVAFRTMYGAEKLGLRAVRREFGAYGEIICAALRADSFRQPESVELEFKDTRTMLKVRDWTGKSSDLPLYRSEGLVDAARRDAETSFLCYVDNFGSVVNTFEDLADFVKFVTDRCSATVKGAALCWTRARGVYAQLDLQQMADQERIIRKVMEETYMSQSLSCSSVCGGEYFGLGEGSYRVDWTVVASEAAMIGIERREGERLKKKEKKAVKLGKKSAKKDAKKKAKEKKKQAKQAKKDKKKAKKREKQEKKEAKKQAKKRRTDTSTSSEDDSASQADAGEAEHATSSSSSASSPSANRAAASGKDGAVLAGSAHKKGRAPMALQGSDASESAAEG